MSVEYTIHNVAKLMPRMSEEEYAGLVADICAHGQREPIWLLGEQILDGRHRYAACLELGIEPQTRQYKGPNDTKALLAFVLSLNEHRRHLTSSQKAVIALESERLLAEEARQRQIDLAGTRPNTNSDLEQMFAQGRKDQSRDQAAALAGTNRQYVSDAKRLSTTAPELLDKVRDGELNIPEANALEPLPPEQRNAALALAHAHDLSIKRAVLLANALSDAGPRTRALAEKAQIDNPELVDFLADGERDGREWFDELEASGFIQPGDEETAVGLSAGLAALQAAVDERARLHRSIGAQAANKPFVTHNTGEMEWLTPPDLLDAARQVLGGFDLDPASCLTANRIVQAKCFYDAQTDGLSKPWRGRVWLNPPYSQPLITRFVKKLVGHVLDGKVTACLLVNNATETAWFQEALDAATRVCFLKGRVRFLDAEGNPNGTPLQGQAVLYYGQDAAAFIAAFKDLGAVLRGPKAYV